MFNPTNIAEAAEDEDERSAYTALDAAVDRLKLQDMDALFCAHSTFTHGMHQLFQHSCLKHRLEELEFVRRWIDERIADTKKEMN
jgi:hypothetical protein